MRVALSRFGVTAVAASGWLFPDFPGQRECYR